MLILGGLIISLVSGLLSTALTYTLLAGRLPCFAQTFRLADSRFSSVAGSQPGQGALTLFDRATDKQFVELGFYSYGAGLFTPDRFEFWTGKEVSVAGWNHLPAFQVRNQADTDAAVWINGARYIGSGSDYLGFAFGSYNGGWTEVARFNESGELIVHRDIVIGTRSLSARLDRLERLIQASQR